MAVSTLVVLAIWKKSMLEKLLKKLSKKTIKKCGTFLFMCYSYPLSKPIRLLGVVENHQKELF